MNPIAWEEAKDKRATSIFEDFYKFTDGTRVLFLIQRHKEGGETNNTKLTKLVSRDGIEWFLNLKELVGKKMESENSLRIYGSVNSRDFKKAIHKFKIEQLDAEMYCQDQIERFYLDLRNRFIGCLMQPANKETSLFLFDIDNEEGRDVHEEALNVIPNEHIVHVYKTKNGWHIITNPFNYTKIKLPDGVELKKDGLLLLDY